MASTKEVATTSWRDWTRLPENVVDKIATIFLEDDVIDYCSFRATCHDWRLFTQQFSQLDPLAPCFRPRRWIMLSDVDGSPTDAMCFLNITTGKTLRMEVPEFRQEDKILATTDGIFVIINDTEIKVLNPLTRFCIKFPIYPFYRRVRAKSAAVTSSGTVILCSILVSENRRLENQATVLYANRSFPSWKTIADGTFLSYDMRFRNILLFHDILYTVDGPGRIKGLNLNAQPAVTNITAPTFGINSDSFYLVESRGQMLLVRNFHRERNSSENVGFEVFEVDLTHGSLIRVGTIGDQALIVSDKLTLSISANCIPTVEGNSVYFVRHIKLPHATYRMGCWYNLTRGSASNIHLFRILHELNYSRTVKDLVRWENARQSIRPYSLIDHLLCYCYQRAWRKCLMFMELGK